MRKFILLLSFFCFILTTASAQINGADECSGAIALGEAPTCPDETVYTNAAATASVLPFENTPVCFSTEPDRDVWFTFTVPADGSMIDFTVQLFSFVGNGNGIQNPQIAVYRIDGTCDDLAEYDCISAPDGNANVAIDLVGLTPGEIYYLRINDYSATGTPNAGDFTVCVSEFVPFFNMCDATASTSCFGTLYDSGGPDGDYSANENCTFTICPNDFNECIVIDMAEYNLENNFDNLIFYAGADVNAPVISTISGAPNGNPFEIQTDSDCITIQMTSDDGVQQSGFELTWQCSPLDCDSSLDDITVIPSLPFESDNLTTCDNAGTFQGTSCGVLPFLAGPESVFTYTTDGGSEECYSIQITGAATGTGVLVLDGPPSDPASICIASSTTGNLGSVNFSDAGTYYIIVGNGDGCTDFDISIQPSSCVLDPSLQAALCNPLNGCQNEDGLPSIFNFNTDFFVDVDISSANNNNGCWGGIGAGNFYWFTIQSAADGPFGFTFQSADPAEASDIDFNVWGPFTNEQVCQFPEVVTDIIGSTQPLASSYAGGTEPTGLIDIHPITGTPQEEFYDCQGVNGSGNDDFVSTIPTTLGEVYVVLVNDWGGDILSGQVQVDFSASGPGVLDAIDQLVEIDVETAEVCQGTPVQLEIESESNNITWTPSESLSCSDCPNPIATPTETTEYTVTIDGVCVDAIGTATVNVYGVDAGPDLEACLGEELQIVSGQVYENATYEWSGGPAGSISDPTVAAPIITALQPGTFTYSVILNAPGCVVSDQVVITVTPEAAAMYEVADDMDICNGETVGLGGQIFPNTGFLWTSDPPGFASVEGNPLVTPTETTTYYLNATNLASGCTNPSVDSVTITVFEPITLSANPDIAICQGDTIVLSTLEPEDDVEYLWTPAAGIIGGDPTIPNVSAVPQETTTYTLTAVRGACTEQISVTVTVSEISINIDAPSGDTGICVGESVEINATAAPDGIEVVWTPTEGLDAMTGTELTATPTVPTEYIATVSVPGCVRTDTLFIDVDSLPVNMDIMPQDTVVCESEIVVLTSPVYDSGFFPGITHTWTPDIYQETEDTLYNLVVTPAETTTYSRLTVNGFCSQVDTAQVIVQDITVLTITPAEPVICPGDTVQLLVTSDDPLITEFEWDEDPSLSCTDCPDPMATPNTTTSYLVNGISEAECPIAAMVTVTVLPQPEAPAGASFCEPQTINLNNGGSTDPEFTYSWTEVDGNFSSTEVNPSFDLQSTTSFNYSIQAADCPAVTGTITFSIAAEESVTITGDTDICAGETTVLTAETSADSGVFDWSPGGETTNSITVGAAGVYTVTYIPNEQDCPEIFFTDEITVSVFDFPVLDSLTGPTDCVFEGQQFNLNAFTDGTIITWTDNNGATVGTGTEISVIAPDAIASEDMLDSTTVTYTAFISNEAGCELTGNFDVCVKNTLFQVPNVFTPNNDDINDTFYPFIGETNTLVTFEVYNRWGQKVFDATETGAEAWNGTYNEKFAPADVYAYVIKYIDGFGEEVVVKGDVTLVR